MSYNTSTDLFFLIVTHHCGEGFVCLVGFLGVSGCFFAFLEFNFFNKKLQAFAQDQTFLVGAAL